MMWESLSRLGLWDSKVSHDKPEKGEIVRPLRNENDESLNGKMVNPSHNGHNKPAIEGCDKPVKEKIVNPSGNGDEQPVNGQIIHNKNDKLLIEGRDKPMKSEMANPSGNGHDKQKNQVDKHGNPSGQRLGKPVKEEIVHPSGQDNQNNEEMVNLDNHNKPYNPFRNGDNKILSNPNKQTTEKLSLSNTTQEISSNKTQQVNAFYYLIFIC